MARKGKKNILFNLFLVFLFSLVLQIIAKMSYNIYESNEYHREVNQSRYDFLSECDKNPKNNSYNDIKNNENNYGITNNCNCTKLYNQKILDCSKLVEIKKKEDSNELDRQMEEAKDAIKKQPIFTETENSLLTVW